MRISTLRKIVKHKAVIKNYVPVKIANLRKSNYDEYVKISDGITPETKSYLNGIKPILGKFLKKGNYQATFEPVYNQPQKVGMNLYIKENPVLGMFYDFFEMVHDKPVKLNKETIFIKIKPSEKSQDIPISRRIFNAISDVLKSYDELLNTNLKKD